MIDRVQKLEVINAVTQACTQDILTEDDIRKILKIVKLSAIRSKTGGASRGR